MPNISHLVVKKNSNHVYFEYPALKSWARRWWQAPCLSRKNREACFLLFSTDILDVSPADSLVYLLSICW